MTIPPLYFSLGWPGMSPEIPSSVDIQGETTLTRQGLFLYVDPILYCD